MKTIDYFISSKLLEKPENQKYYTEQLIRLNTLPSMMQLPKPNTYTSNKSQLGLPKNKILIGFPHTLFKLHPDFDDVIEAIARANEDIIFVLINTPSKYHGEKIKRRWTVKIQAF